MQINTDLIDSDVGKMNLICASYLHFGIWGQHDYANEVAKKCKLEYEYNNNNKNVKMAKESK